MKVGRNIHKRADGRYEARYRKGRTAQGRIVYGYCYGKTLEEAEEKRNTILGMCNEESAYPYLLPASNRVKQMNLLILGAGGQGQVVKEIAESIGIFNKIAYLDDNPENTLAIGTVHEYNQFLEEYPIAIPSVGNCELRLRWIKMLAEGGFVIPTLISPHATISPSATIDYGTLIEAKVTIGANTKIASGCIISAGAIIDRDAVIECGCHIGCAAIVQKNTVIAAQSVIV